MSLHKFDICKKSGFWHIDQNALGQKITGFLKQLYLQKKNNELAWFLHAVTNPWKSRWKFLGWHGKKWVWSFLSRYSKVDCISRMNRGNFFGFFVCWIKMKDTSIFLLWAWLKNNVVFLFLGLKNLLYLNPLSANITKWSNTLKQFVDNLATNCFGVFDHFVWLALKELIVNKWIELIFWILTVMQWFLLRLLILLCIFDLLILSSAADVLFKSFWSWKCKLKLDFE